MLWAAYGDALGFITELCPKKYLANRTGGKSSVDRLIPWTRRIGGRFGVKIELPSGCYSDDTQLRLATCRSIRSDGYFDIETFSKVEIPIWLSYSLGAGRGSKTAAESLKKKQNLWYSNFFESEYSSYINCGGNGAAMRIQPHVWSASRAKGMDQMLRDIVRNTIATHGHSRAIVGAAFHALSLRETMLNGEIPSPSQWRSILEQLRELPDIICSDEDIMFYWFPTWEKKAGKSLMSAIMQAITEMQEDISLAKKELLGKAKNDEEKYNDFVRTIGGLKKESSGSATKTALLASYLSNLYRNRPHDGLIVAANLLGSDTDTIATMAGAILGLVAANNPPEPVADMEYLIKEADRMYDISQNRKTDNYAYPDMLYWKSPAKQLDTIAKYNGKWVAQGLGEVTPAEIAAKKEGSNPVVWQWFCLEYGQTILVKRRAKPKTFTEECLPVRITTQGIETKARVVCSRKDKQNMGNKISKQAELWGEEKLVNSHNEENMTVDTATDKVICSGFEEEIVGKMLMKLVEQKDGIEKSIAFAAIIAKAKQARMKKALPRRAGQPWDDEESSLLMSRFEQGMGIKELTLHHKRTKGAIVSQLEKLGKNPELRSQ